MAILIEDVVKNEAEWIAQKVKSIGSGDIATICGANDYQTPLKLWAIKTGREKPDPENDYMWWGKMMERPIAELCGRKLNLDVQYAGMLFGHDNIPWATATPDYFAREKSAPTNEKKILEIKNVNWRGKKFWENETPLYPRLQVMWQMGVAGFKEGIIAPLIGGDIENFDGRLVEYDERIFAQLVELASKFMWHVREDVPPAPTHKDTELVREIVGELEEKTIVLPVEMHPLLKDYELISIKEKPLKAELKQFDDAKAEIKNKLRLAMGSANKAVGGEFKISIKESIIKEAIRAEHKRVTFTIKSEAKDDGEE